MEYIRAKGRCGTRFSLLKGSFGAERMSETRKFLEVTVFPKRNESCLAVFPESTPADKVFPEEWINRIFPDEFFEFCGDRWRFCRDEVDLYAENEDIVRDFAVPFVRAFARFAAGGRKFFESDMAISVKIDSYPNALGLRLGVNKSSFDWTLCFGYTDINTQRRLLSSLCWEVLSEFQAPGEKWMKKEWLPSREGI